MKTLAPAALVQQVVHPLMHDVHHHHPIAQRMSSYFLEIPVALCETKGKPRISLHKLVPRPNANYQMTSGYWKQLNLQM
jgi:hypothetical protein